MRWFLTILVVALLATELVVTAPAPAYAAGQQVAADHAYATARATTKKKTTKKKKKKNTSSSSPSTNNVVMGVSTGPGPVPVTIFNMKDPYVGEKNVFVAATTPTPGLVCHLVVRYRTGDQTPLPDLNADGSNSCTFRFNVPDDRNIIGGAGVLISVYVPGAPATTLGTGTQPFAVKKL